MFAACLARVLVQNGLLTPSQVQAKDLYYMFSENQSTFLNLLGTYDAQEQTRAFQALADYADTLAQLGIPVLVVNPESHEALVEMLQLMGAALGWRTG